MPSRHHNLWSVYLHLLCHRCKAYRREMAFVLGKKYVRYILCCAIGFCCGVVLTSFFGLPDANCDGPSMQAPASPLRTKYVKPEVVLPKILSVPADSSPPVAHPNGRRSIKNEGGDDGPLHRPDAKMLKRVFKGEMKTVAKEQELRFGNRPLTVTEELGIHKTLYVGVVTAKKYFKTRATSINNTWGQLVPKVNFFAPGADSPEGRGLPIVSLPGVDDSYPPQKKVFTMLKYMHDEMKEQYDWFLRADDDLFLRPEELMEFLRTLDARKAIYMGQPGIGFKRDRERLQLNEGEVYCMGGTGVFYSRAALERVRPHLDDCFQEVMSYHEDVEVGRCLSRKAGLQCTWNYELGKLLYYDITEKQFRGSDVPADEKTRAIMSRALTLHPVKDPPMFYKLQKFYTELRIANANKKLESLRKQRQALCRYLPSNSFPEFHQYWPQTVPGPYKPKSRFDVLAWEYFNNKTLFQNVEQQPSLGLGGSNRIDADTAVKTALTMISQLHGGEKVRKFTLVNGYRRLDPTRGVDYIIDISATLASGRSVQERLKFLRPFGDVQLVDELKYNNTAAINIIVPVSGIAARFQEFLSMFEKVCLSSSTEQQVKLVVVVFGNGPADYAPMESVLKKLRARHRRAVIRSVPVQGKFSRARGLDAGARTVPAHELMFFVDADLDLKEDFLGRCRRNTARGAQVYFPVVFMLFNPAIVYPTGTVPKVPVIGRDTGHWAYYAYGMVCIYRHDYDAVNGFDLSIKGWGAEDVKFYDKILESSQLRAFRAVDPSLIHRFHEKKCDPKLTREQFRMCIGALAEGFASKSQLANLYLQSPSASPSKRFK